MPGIRSCEMSPRENYKKAGYFYSAFLNSSGLYSTLDCLLSLRRYVPAYDVISISLFARNWFGRIEILLWK
jgi:hypothetical protein